MVYDTVTLKYYLASKNEPRWYKLNTNEPSCFFQLRISYDSFTYYVDHHYKIFTLMAAYRINFNREDFKAYRNK